MPSKVVRFLDLRVTDPEEREAILSAIGGVLSHGRIILGPEVEALEARIARACGRRFAVGVGSGSDALLLALRALGIGPGDEVITTPMSFVATANAISLAGAAPVFADVGDDLNLDPATVEARITPRTRAILCVHYRGRLCDVGALRSIADRRGLLLVEDCAQAYGATWQGRPAGSFGRIGCLSFNPMKVLGACGDAGGVVTDEPDLRERLVASRYNGLVERERCETPSHNARLDTLQAAVLLARLDRLDGVLRRRRDIVRQYTERLGGLVDCPRERPEYVDVPYVYTIRTPRRDALLAHLQGAGVEARVYHPRALTEHPAYASARGASPRALALVTEILSIPCHEKLDDGEVERVIDAVESFFRKGR